MSKPKTIAELKRTEYKPRSVKEEIRENLIRMLSAGQSVFPGIIGYEQSVIPEIENALLACHNFILLGLRGQAKTRLIRSLMGLLDQSLPAIWGCPLHSDPLNPQSAHARRQVAEKGDEAEIEWLSREQRFNEKLATPDVSVADLIGDLDPIKAMSQSLSFSDEEAIHYGIVPRTNRGIFAINELPDLQPRIQVSLLNIMEEKDVQIRGFPVRIPLDILMVFTANPEDYTNRGNIITPLKDRIDAQILTHYPKTIEDAISITRQESWSARMDGRMTIPPYVETIVAQVAQEARGSEYVDQSSGVSARMNISFFETLQSAIERRLLRTGDKKEVCRMCDLYACIPAISGKVELVYKGEQEGLASVSHYLVGRGIREVFNQLCVKGYRAGSDRKLNPQPFSEIVSWFESGNSLPLSENLPHREYLRTLQTVPGLEKMAVTTLRPTDDLSKAAAMEFVLEGLSLHHLISKKTDKQGIRYIDSLAEMLSAESGEDERYI